MQDKGEALQLEERAEGVESESQRDSLATEPGSSPESTSPEQESGNGLGETTKLTALTEEAPEQEATLSQEAAQSEDAERPAPSGAREEAASAVEPAIPASKESAEKESASGASMDNLMQDMGHDYRSFRRGDIVEGTIVSIDKDGILVDIGTKSEAIIPGHEAARYISPGKEQVQVGDEVVACVVQPENAEGHVVLSLSRARVERGWRQVQKIFDAGQSVEADVVDHNKGGLIVNIDGVRGFVPISQIAGLRQNTASEGEIETRLAGMVGKRIPVKVLEINRRRNRLILSERAAVSERRAQRKEQLLSELREGDIRRGVVSSICDFGAFVDLGGADGLVHLSELSWGQISHPSEAAKVGDEVDVYVLSVDREKKKIALSVRRSMPEPWTLVSEKYRIDDIVTATVTKLATFGAFARVEPGVEGLIHVSEMAEGRVAHPSNVVKEGDVVRVRVIRVDPEHRRLGLSLRQVPKLEEQTAVVEAPDEVDTSEAQPAAEPNQADETTEAMPAGEE